MKIYVYNFADLKLIDHIETLANPKGLCVLCPHNNNTVLVCPGMQKGHVRVELYDAKKTTFIIAHETNLACAALNFDGTLLATASDKGTLIRIFDTSSGELVQELRRGADKAEIFSIAFDATSQWLAVSSDKGTIHIFKLKRGAGGAADGDRAVATSEDKHEEPPKSGAFSFIKGILPKYFSSEWSFAQFRVPDVRTIVSFGTEKNSIVVVASDGSFYKALFDPQNGGECVQESYAKFIDSV
jgi:WD40 repeat protein